MNGYGVSVSNRNRTLPHWQDAWTRTDGILPQPPRRHEPPPSGGIELDVRLVEGFAIPQLAGDLLVLLIERLAVVGVFAAPHLGAAAELDLEEPIGVGQGRARHADDVGVSVREDGLGLLECADAA